MSRTLLSSALLVAFCAATVTAAAAASKPLPSSVRSTLRARMPISSIARARASGGPGITTHNNSVLTCFFDESILLDQDGDDELSRGDSIIANGALVDRFGRKLGTWEGTIVDTSSPTLSFNITLRFVNDGTVVINGAAYPDGIRSGAFSAPIVGKTGRMTARGNAGLGFDDDGNLVVILGVR